MRVLRAPSITVNSVTLANTTFSPGGTAGIAGTADLTIDMGGVANTPPSAIARVIGDKTCGFTALATTPTITGTTDKSVLHISEAPLTAAPAKALHWSLGFVTDPIASMPSGWDYSKPVYLITAVCTATPGVYSQASASLTLVQ